MKKLNKLIITAVAVLVVANSYSSWGQISNIHTVSGQPIMIQKTYGVEGTPYFNTEWRTGTVLYNQQRMENVQMKYNAFEDQIEILYNNTPFLPEKKMVQGFEFAQVESGALISYRFKKGFEGDGVNKENYLSLIYEGTNLVLAEQIKMDQISVTPATYGEREYKEFKLAKSYVLIKQGKAQRFRPSKRSFINEFPGIEPKLKNYFKESDVNFDDYGDLAEVVAFIEGALVNNN